MFVIIVGQVSCLIIVEGVILAGWEFSAIINCYEGKREALERGNYRRLKLTDQIVGIARRVIERLIR